MNMDRQAILDQKRQRLQELRQRRADIGSINHSKPSGSTASPVKRVDFSVQVDLVSSVRKHASESDSESSATKDVLKFDKAIQTDELWSRDDQLPSTVNEVIESVQPSKEYEVQTTKEHVIQATEKLEESTSYSSNVVQEALCKQLASWDLAYPFSELRLGLQQKEELGPDTAPFQKRSQLQKFIKRPIICIASTPEFPDVFLVAYGKIDPSLSQPNHRVTTLAGLAVIFNTRADHLIPEFFLRCSSTIVSITFDKSNPAKVFAGLSNGRIVMWDVSDVKPTQIALLPTLTTSPIVSDEAENKNLIVLPHSSPILYLDQPMWKKSQDATFVSICSNGIVNMWSPNMLAYPELSSVQIGPVAARVHEVLCLSAAIITTKSKTAREESVPKVPEYNFLNLTLIGTKSGSIINLLNSESTLYLGQKMLIPQNRLGPYDCAVTSFIELYGTETELLLSVHSDWTLRFWDCGSGKHLYSVPTSTAIRGASLRPGKNYQILTYGDIKPPSEKFCVEFWDLEVRLSGPLFVLPTKDALSGTASFSTDGEAVFVAYSDGDIDLCSVNDELLREQADRGCWPSVDKGLLSITSVNRSIEI